MPRCKAPGLLIIYTILTLCSADQATITFRVGSNVKPSILSVPETLIRTSSQFVDAAMKGPWQESQERVISLPEFDHETFGIYFQRLVTGKLHTKQQPHASTSGPRLFGSDTPFGSEARLLGKLSSLGHYLLDVGFQDAVSDGIIQCSIEYQHRVYYGPSVFITHVYNTIPPKSPTKQLVVDICAWTTGDSALQCFGMYRFGPPYDADFLLELIRAMASRFLSEPPAKSPLEGWETSCKYHCHGNEKPCYREKSKKYVAPSTVTEGSRTDFTQRAYEQAFSTR
jgi:hypothetical protein